MASSDGCVTPHPRARGSWVSGYSGAQQQQQQQQQQQEEQQQQPGSGEPGELAQTQLAWVEPPGVHRELKDMDPCQHISYIAHILQVQLRIGDRGPSPLAARPAICPPGAGGSEA
ncbi:unnamed protein product [Pleuronectes platessa]|uniref:Uncharacterized protein n=1 Tax=Pleuronectes platessa TaxID=8262 RepID=A0A9N7UI40_PLEPL|nr:unnamed protein product [Pleuronectes platessa]